MNNLGGKFQNRIKHEIKDNDTCTLNKSILVSQNNITSEYQTLTNDHHGLKVNLTNIQTAFGELKTASHYGVIQEVFTYLIHPEIYNMTTIGSSSVFHNNTMCNIQTGTTTGSTAVIETKKRIKYQAGQGVCFRGTCVFNSPIDGTQQWVGLGDINDGLFFGYTGLTFGILHRNGGVDTFIQQSAWNKDKCDGSQLFPNMIWTFGNVFQINFQYLGFGRLAFYIINPITHVFEQVHVIEYANTNIVPSLSNPSLPWRMEINNLLTTEDLTMSAASLALFVEGGSKPNGILHAYELQTTDVKNNDLINCLTIRNRPTFNGKINNNQVFPKIVSIANENVKPAFIRVFKNAAVSGQVFANYNTIRSIVDVDTALNGVLTGGTAVYSTVCPKEGVVTINLGDLGVYLHSGETLSITATTFGGIADIFAALTWLENI